MNLQSCLKPPMLFPIPSEVNFSKLCPIWWTGVKQTCYFTLTSGNQIVDGQAGSNGAKTASLAGVETFCTTVWAEYTLSQKCKTERQNSFHGMADFKSENFRPITYGCPRRQVDHLSVAHLLTALAREKDRKRMVLLFLSTAISSRTLICMQKLQNLGPEVSKCIKPTVLPILGFSSPNYTA